MKSTMRIGEGSSRSEKCSGGQEDFPVGRDE